MRRRTVRGRGTSGAPVARAGTPAGGDPLEIRLGGRPLTVTMRPPGDDADLAAGFRTGEGVVAGPDHIAAIARRAGATGAGRTTSNVLGVRLADAVPARS